MRLGLAAMAAVLAGSALPMMSAHAMQFDPMQAPSGDAVVIGRGPIVHGDTGRLTAALAAVRRSGRPLSALALDSGGGNLVEALRLVDPIRSQRIAVVIPRSSQCASACFLLFAASPRRLAAADALVGVHSASQNGAETDMSLAVTTLMARDARDLGVPPAIIGKMVQTTPGRVEWLDPGDLALMNVTVYDGDLSVAIRRIAQAGMLRTATPSGVEAPRDAAQEYPKGGLPATAAGPPPGPPPGMPPAPPAAFTLGRQDRRAWEAWFSSLRGPYRDGALFARSQIDRSLAPSCYGPNNVNRGDFTLGCSVASQRLSAVNTKLRADPDYAAGWNAAGWNAAGWNAAGWNAAGWNAAGSGSPGAAATGGQQLGVDEPVEREFQGVYFCASQIARLTVKLFAGAIQPHRRALIVFGPHATSPHVPHGAFEVEGTVDAAAGTLTLAPLQWRSQPVGYAWFGVDGRSDDGGRTYSGRITGNSACTRFTLARSNVTAAEQ